jgi:UDP-glucose 4-epimerase
VDNKKSSILITGGFGNLGSWLTEYFHSLGHNVTVLASRRRNVLEHIDLEFIECDISSETACHKALRDRKFDVIIHAASVNEGFAPNYSQTALLVNAYGTRNLLDAVRLNSPRNFIYLSTFQVYGRYEGIISEDSNALPKNDYGLSHLFAEYYIRSFSQNHRLPYTILRLTNSYGAPKDINSSKWYLVLNDLSRSAFREKKITLQSNGRSLRDFIWMRDVCEVIEKLARIEGKNRVFNLSGEQSFRMIEIAEFIRDAYFDVYGEALPIEVNTNDSTDHSLPLFVSSSELRKIVPFKPRQRFKEEAVEIFSLLHNQDSQKI